MVEVDIYNWCFPSLVRYIAMLGFLQMVVNRVAVNNHST